MNDLSLNRDEDKVDKSSFCDGNDRDIDGGLLLFTERLVVNPLLLMSNEQLELIFFILGQSALMDTSRFLVLKVMSTPIKLERL